MSVQYNSKACGLAVHFTFLAFKIFATENYSLNSNPMENVQLVNKVIICKDLHSIKQWKRLLSSLSLSICFHDKFQKQEIPETELCILLNYNQQIVLKSLDLIWPVQLF